MKIGILTMALSTLTLMGCSPQPQQNSLASHEDASSQPEYQSSPTIDYKKQKLDLLKSKIDFKQSQISIKSENTSISMKSLSETQLSIQAKRGEIAEYKSQVEAYLMNHKLAVAAITGGVGGTTIALDPNNEFSEEMETVAGAVAIASALYAISNMEEIKEVADTIQQSSAHIESLKAQLSSLELTEGKQNSELLENQNQLQSLEEELRILHSEYESLL